MSITGNKNRKRAKKKRLGAAVVEFALIVPIFLTLVFGIIEFGRLMMVQQVLVNASREGARRAVLEGATVADVTQEVSNYLSSSSINVPSESIVVSPDPTSIFNNENISVSISIPFSSVSWMPPLFYSGDLQANTTMRSEKLN